MHPSTPTTPTILAPPPGGALLCLTLSHHAARVARAVLRQLIELPPCGIQWWPRRPQVLFVVWAQAGEESYLSAVLSAFGPVTEWPLRLCLFDSGWEALAGAPLYATREYEIEVHA